MWLPARTRPSPAQSAQVAGGSPVRGGEALFACEGEAGAKHLSGKHCGGSLAPAAAAAAAAAASESSRWDSGREDSSRCGLLMERFQNIKCLFIILFGGHHQRRTRQGWQAARVGVVEQVPKESQRICIFCGETGPPRQQQKEKQQRRASSSHSASYPCGPTWSIRWACGA